MRSNWNPTLESWLRRTDPKARLILEAAAIANNGTSVDIRQRPSQWNAADSTAGFDVGSIDGIVRLLDTPVAGPTWSSANRNNYLTTLNDPGLGQPIGAEITWGDVDNANAEISDINVWLDPANNTAPNTGVQKVVVWKCQVFIVELLANVETAASGTYRLTPITDPIQAVAGASAGMVKFDYAGRALRIRPKAGGSYGQTAPTTLIMVWGLDATGTVATNVGLGIDTAHANSGGTNVIATAQFVPKPDGSYVRNDQAETPIITINMVSVAATGTLAFTGGGNKINLGATPVGVVEFTCWGRVPPGSSLTFQAKVLVGDPWVTVVDGSTIGAGTSTDVALARSQTYFTQVLFAADPSLRLSPELVAMGAKEIAITSFDGLLANHSVGWTIDPVTLRAEIAEAQFELIRDGEYDYNSAIDTLLSQNDIANIDLRLWIGHPDLARNLWMLIDTFQIDDSQNVTGAATILIAVSPIQQIKQDLPVYKAATGLRQILQYTNQTLSAAFDDIVTNQIGLPGRLYGPAVLDAKTVTKTITIDDKSDAKRELDALAFLSGGANICSQGRLKFVKVIPDFGAAADGQAIRTTIPAQEITYGMVTPGFRLRSPEFFVPYGYDFTNKRFIAESRGFHATAIAKLGSARLDPPTRLDDLIAKWIPSPAVIAISSITRVGTLATVTTGAAHGFVTGQYVTMALVTQADYNGTFPVTVTDATHFTYVVQNNPTTPATVTNATATAGLANQIAQRQANQLGTGVITLTFQTNYAHPELELGDVIAVQTTQFVAKDPISAAAIKGKLWAIGVIVGQHDAWGTAWTMWVRSYADLLSGNAAATRIGFAYPEVLAGGLAGTPDGTISCNFRCRDAKGIRYASSKVGFPTAATVAAAALHALTSDANYYEPSIGTLNAGETLYVSSIAYENADGTGSSSTTMGQFRIDRVQPPAKNLRFTFANAVHDDDPVAAYDAIVIDSAAGYVHPNVAPMVNGAVCNVMVPVPVGVTITHMRCSAKTTTVGITPDQVRIKLFRQPLSGAGAPTAVADTGLMQGIAFANPTNDQTCNETTAGNSYFFWIDMLIKNGAIKTAVGVEWIEIQYVPPSYYQTY